jgi:hypothetical protein
MVRSARCARSAGNAQGRWLASASRRICSTKSPCPRIRASVTSAGVRGRMARTATQPPRDRRSPPPRGRAGGRGGRPPPRAPGRPGPPAPGRGRTSPGVQDESDLRRCPVARLLR